MSIFKCKMCGGTIEFEPGATVGVCDSCGTKQTLPRLDDDRRANLYDRANHFRRSNEFDKAAGLYEQILNEDPTDAEAYWSLVLCRYGIEYVEDPSTHKRVPTVNRTQFTSIFDDEDYKSALEHADGYQRAIYEEEAVAINEIQKGILTISQKEKPFDVFICYKETDDAGRRTPDSVLATDLYHQLTQEGFKVFFSRITLEDKLGIEYEPYIFAALNSAKVMVVLGTKPEYFNAVWVKNEWSRYLKLIKAGARKTLIPAYRDMDPYDLPEEFSHLMALDMSKLGFMQDLVRGIKKIIGSDEPKPAEKETVVVSSPAGNTNAAPLLRRAFLFLEDGDWARADDFCEQVLNREPENAQAYLGKLMAALHVRRPEELADCEQPFDNNNNYSKILRFGDEELSAAVRGYIDHINERNELARRTGIYNRACSAREDAGTEAEYRAAAELFRTIAGFRDADEQTAACLEQAERCWREAIAAEARRQEQLRLEGIYKNSCDMLKLSRTPEELRTAAENFAYLGDYKDSAEKQRECLDKAAKREQARQAAEAKATTKRARSRWILPMALVCVAAFLGGFFLVRSFLPSGRYEKAQKLAEAGRYEEAITAFEALGDYKDSAEQILPLTQARDYAAARQLAEAGNYEEAIAAFEALGDYKDSAEQAYSLYLQHRDAILNSATLGDIVLFGTYEQDNNSDNGQEYIEWQVLAKENNRLLVISKYGLDSKAFHSGSTSASWEESSLRAWLNSDFIDAALSEKEQEMIPRVHVSADKNPEYRTDPGNSTTDQVFLLSITEANRYFHSNKGRRCEPTAYAITKGCYVGEETSSCWWWLRTPGINTQWEAFIFGDGRVSSMGSYTYVAGSAVRPAMWIDLGA